jgi:predicted ester cyclase
MVLGNVQSWSLMMSVETNQRKIYELIEAANAHDVVRQAALFHVDATNHGRAVGRNGLLRVLTSLYETFPDWRYELHHLVANEDSVMAMMTMTGTHTGVAQMPIVGGLINGVEPTGKSVSVLHFHLYRFKGDEIIEHSAVRDDLGLMQQLGLIARSAGGDISRPPQNS